VSGAVVWITGLPASGKTTLAGRIRDRLSVPSVVLDSDALRPLLGATGYDDEGRADFYDRLAGLAAHLASQGLVVLVAATANRRAYRARARALAPRYLEVFVQASLDDVRRRDPRGLYARAARGEAADVPGVGAPYEPPAAPDVTATGGLDDEALAAVLTKLQGP
jgi:adenylylsulfate kinase